MGRIPVESRNPRRSAEKSGKSSARGGVRAGRTWKQDPDGRRERILAAAEREIAEKGIDGVRTGPLARRAGVAEGTVFHLFGSKDSLFGEVGRRFADGMVEAAFDRVTADPAAPDFDAFVNAIFDYAAEHRELLQAYFWMSHAPSARALSDAFQNRVVDAIEAAIGAEGAESTARYSNLRVAAAVQFGLVENALRDCFMRTGGEQQAAYRREVARSLRALTGTDSN